MEQQLEASNRLLRALTDAQTEFIRGSDAHALFNRLLTVLLDLTNSEYGFIGEVLTSPEGKPYLRTHAITNIAWTDELREFYARQAPLGLEFFNLHTLFGAVLTSGQHVLSNEPSQDPRRGGIPDGHPPLKAFLGLPFNSGGAMVGMVGIANRPGGYDQGVIDFLQPFLATCCSVILGWRSEKQRRQAEELLRHREEELRKHRDHLEELVQERTEKLLRTTKELERHQLAQQEKLIALGELAGNIAHEINNPMGYVMSNLNMLTRYIAAFTRVLQGYREFEAGAGAQLQGPPAEALSGVRALWEKEDLSNILADVPDLLSEAQEGTQRVKDIVQSLKKRMQHHKEEARPQLVDLNKELATALKMMAWDELQHRCEVRTDYGQVPPILGFSTEISQVFTNLLSNAAYAIEERGEIRVTTKQEGDMVVVSVSDTGHGMPPEVQAKIFTPFFTTKPPGKGTGLGLAISYNIIARHHGRIEVQSQPGQGTTFTLWLPAAPEALRATLPEKSPEASAGGSSH